MNTLDKIDLGTHSGFDITAEIVPDNTYMPEPDGDYSAEQIAAYKNGDWSYVTIIVAASRSDVLLGSDSLGMVEYGSYPMNGGVHFIDPLRDDNGSLAAYRGDMIEQAVADANMKLSELEAVEG